MHVQVEGALASSSVARGALLGSFVMNASCLETDVSRPRAPSTLGSDAEETAARRWMQPRYRERIHERHREPVAREGERKPRRLPRQGRLRGHFYELVDEQDSLSRSGG
jgi:hypothetical protein